MPAASFAAMQADRGVVVSFRQAYRVAWSRFGRSLWLMILMVLCIMIPIMVVGALLAGGMVWVTGVKRTSQRVLSGSAAADALSWNPCLFNPDDDPACGGLSGGCRGRVICLDSIVRSVKLTQNAMAASSWFWWWSMRLFMRQFWCSCLFFSF